MKINQWTLGLAAVGVVSLASVVNAEEMNTVQTALSTTTISGYVDTSINWNSIDNAFSAPIAGNDNGNKNDGFNLNVVKLSLEKAMDESEWAAGYKVDLLFGPDAVDYNPSFSGNNQNIGYSGSDFGIQQAYVALRTPVGNGIDWKMGVFNGILGYETFDAGNNPNFTRSYGYLLSPTTHTGLLGTYRINDNVAVALGLANTLSAGINDKNNELGAARTTDAWREAVMGSIALTAPEDMGFLSGSTLYAGVAYGINQTSGSGGGFNDPQTDFYVGATMNTPVANLKAGLAFNYDTSLNSTKGDDAWVVGGYLSYQASEKLSLHGRAEIGTYDNDLGGLGPVGVGAGDQVNILALTGTVQYDLWANVVSRLEVRYDQADYKDAAAAVDDPESAVGVYANFIYKF